MTDGLQDRVVPIDDGQHLGAALTRFRVGAALHFLDDAQRVSPLGCPT
jgi:hypothetical protein